MLNTVLAVLWKEPLEIMWKGLLSIFIVASVVFLSVIAMNRIITYFATKKTQKLNLEKDVNEEELN